MFRNDPRTADASVVVVLFAIFGALLASCGVGLVAVGTGMLVEGNAAGVVGVLCGLPACYGGYLFWRAAVRIRRDLHEHPLNWQQQRSRRGKIRFLLGYTVVSIVGSLTLPVPGLVRVLMVVAALVVVPVILAGQFEPAKRPKSSGG